MTKPNAALDGIETYPWVAKSQQAGIRTTAYQKIFSRQGRQASWGADKVQLRLVDSSKKLEHGVDGHVGEVFRQRPEQKVVLAPSHTITKSADTVTQRVGHTCANK